MQIFYVRFFFPTDPWWEFLVALSGRDSFSPRDDVKWTPSGISANLKKNSYAEPFIVVSNSHCKIQLAITVVKKRPVFFSTSDIGRNIKDRIAN